MFSNVNEVVQQLYLAEQGGYQFVIDWQGSCYRSDYLEQDPWEYYFEPCFDLHDIKLEDLPVLAGGGSVACAKNNIITPRQEDGQCVPMLLPQDRQLPHRIIERYIHVQAHLQEMVDDFSRQYFTAPVVGLHLRGAGCVDGGAQEQRQRFPCKKGVPFERYFGFVDQWLADTPGGQVFACSDSSFVMSEIEQRYTGRVLSYNSIRSPFGEMHHSNYRENGTQSFTSYKLGEDVLIEAFLLAGTDYLVHGISNVVNFALCKNPQLGHVCVYAETE